MKKRICAAFTIAILVAPAAGWATIVNIDAAVTGCDSTHCSGEHVGPGTKLYSVLSPTQVTLAAGAYTITNGDGMLGANANFTAWNYNDSGANWLWSFMAVADDTLTVLVDSLPDPGISVVATQAQAAVEPAALNYVGHFTLAAPTTVDFVTEDYYPYDNLGGVALNVQLDGAAPSGAPEPASWALMLIGLGVVGAGLRTARGDRALV